MTHGRDFAGLLLDNRPRACGICGHYGKLSKTHVPPQVAGNTGAVERTNMMNDSHDGFGPGRWFIGGMWVRGLCRDCNNFAGQRYDLAYGDFAHRLLSWFDRPSRLHLREAQAVSLAPGRVARSILSGMLGVSPHIRELHPTLARQMEAGGPVRLPGGLTLRLAVHLSTGPQLTGPMLSGFTDGTGRAINTLAAVTFRPLSWALVASGSDDILAQRGWADATDWLLYEDDRESHDLRWLEPRGLPVVPTILHAASSDGFQMYSKELAPIMAGRIPRL
jgi:hypothetical protein